MSLDVPAPLGANPHHACALEEIERVLLAALGRDSRTAPVFTPRNVVALAHEAARKLVA
jgi:hypothetical protein